MSRCVARSAKLPCRSRASLLVVRFECRSPLVVCSQPGNVGAKSREWMLPTGLLVSVSRRNDQFTDQVYVADLGLRPVATLPQGHELQQHDTLELDTMVGSLAKNGRGRPRRLPDAEGKSDAQGVESSSVPKSSTRSRHQPQVFEAVARLVPELPRKGLLARRAGLTLLSLLMQAQWALWWRHMVTLRLRLGRWWRHILGSN